MGNKPIHGSNQLEQDANIFNMNILDARFREIIDLLPVYLSIQDRELNILFANQTFINDFGNGVGKTCHEVYKTSKGKCPNCPVHKTFQDKKVHLSEETIQTLDGKISQMIIYSAPILDKTGDIESVMELAVNITKVKAIQKELTSVGQSMAYMSHGIKNILEALQGGSYIIDEGLHDEDLDLVRSGWDIVRNNILDISVITQNVLYSSKKRKPLFEKVFPDEILEVPVKLFNRKAAALNIVLTCEPNPDLPPVLVDIFSIRRMFNNLVSNAIEACQKDKAKDSHAITLKADIYNEFQFKFEVEDNGTGMDENTKKNMLKEFFSTKGTSGTGLGLAVVNQIVKEHHGKLEVESYPGKGSTFRIILKL
jgi:signal transduction histidine kinase